MFGLPSIGKLLVLAAILGAVWYGFKMIGRMQQSRDAQNRQNAGGSNGSSTPSKKEADGALDMVQCPACKSYIPPDSKCHCGAQG
ncbi:hypothetical protein [Denitrobaculum tricleocarpae]|uniref:Uncharacterized protein n=1 Tax=Denitrobaculum tricleocarpae TaxID=2591009 RepID=A0A545TXD8_9PROT|nr:hypothetical protein [Denitrobaculum tricleocarpae]TQV81895.1 hypothetical protein FKG95_06560 [Denitrobaculum tricleocarpae]